MASFTSITTLKRLGGKGYHKYFGAIVRIRMANWQPLLPRVWVSRVSHMGANSVTDQDGSNEKKKKKHPARKSKRKKKMWCSCNGQVDRQIDRRMKLFLEKCVRS